MAPFFYAFFPTDVKKLVFTRCKIALKFFRPFNNGERESVIKLLNKQETKTNLQIKNSRNKAQHTDS